jgi:hypothetical protein
MDMVTDMVMDMDTTINTKVLTLKVLTPAVDTRILALFKMEVDTVQDKPLMEDMDTVTGMDTVTNMDMVITEVKVLQMKVARHAEPVIMLTMDGLNAKTKMADGFAVSNVTRE